MITYKTLGIHNNLLERDAQKARVPQQYVKADVIYCKENINMKKMILAFVFIMFVFGCHPTADMMGYNPPTVKGVTKPTIFTIPPRYLDSFPLGTVTEEDLINNLGIPGDSYKLNGKTYLS